VFIAVTHQPPKGFFVNRHLSLLCFLCIAYMISPAKARAQDIQSWGAANGLEAQLSTLTLTPSPLPVSSCGALDTIQPARFLGYGAFDGSVYFTISNNGTEVVYLTAFELVWPDATHPEIDANSSHYHLRQVVQGNSVSDPSGRILWTSVGDGQDATGNVKTTIPHDVATDSRNPLEGNWQADGILYPGDNTIWLDFDGFEGSIRQFDVLRHHFNGSRFFFSVGQPCDVLPTPTYGPSVTSSLTATNTLPFDPTLTTFTPTPSRTPTLTPSVTPTKTPSSTRTATRTPTMILSMTPSSTMTPSPTPSSTPTLTPSLTLDPCGFLPPRTPTSSAGGDSVGPRTTPCPATFTPTFTPSQTPTETPTVTPSVTDLPSLTPEPTMGSRHPIQLLVNPGMDNPIPDPVGWQVKHVPTIRKDDRMRLNKGRGVFVFKGGPDEKTKLKQIVFVGLTPLQVGDTLNLRVSYHQKGPKPVAHAKLHARYSDGSTGSIKLHINARTPDYITLSESLLIDSASSPHLLTVTLVNKSQKPKTKIFIDNVELWWMPAP
jgi:hypothetical protein